MKLAVVGGGSVYTPELVEGLVEGRGRLQVDELVLFDIDASRLAIVGGLAGRMLVRGGTRTRLRLTGDLDDALRAADLVLIQIRVGGHAARFGDETVPLWFGRIGQETTGAGGFAKAMRTVPVVIEIAERARRLAAPDAWIIDFTNPVGIVTRALLEAGHRAVGLCNSAISFQRRLAARLEVDPGRLAIDQVGLNHLNWVRRLLLDGRDVLPQLLEDHGAELAEGLGFPERLVRTLGVLPSSYLRYYYQHETMVEHQRDSDSRAEHVARIDRQLLELYRDPALATKPKQLEQRGGAFYSRAALDLMASLLDGAGDIQVVSLCNRGAIQGMAPDDIVEIPARIRREGPLGVPQPPVAPELLGLMQRVAAYERLTVRAATSGDRRDAQLALLAHPLIGQHHLVEPLLEALLGRPAGGRRSLA